MHINITDLFSHDVSEVIVERELPIADINFGGEQLALVAPIQVNLLLNRVEVNDYLMQGNVETALTMQCSRCMDDVTKTITIDFTKQFKLDKREEDEDTAEYLNGSVLDLAKLVLDEVYMNVPMKVLCKEDCNGICKTCGANKNHEDCHCEDDNIDPRLAGLKDLIDFNE